MGSGSSGWRMYNTAEVPLWRTVGDMPPSRKSPTTRASLASSASTKLSVDHVTPILASSLRGSLLASFVGASLLASVVSGSGLGSSCADADRVAVVSAFRVVEGGDTGASPETGGCAVAAVVGRAARVAGAPAPGTTLTLTRASLSPPGPVALRM